MRRPIIDEDERKQKIRIRRRAAALRCAAKRKSIKELIRTEYTNCESNYKNLNNSKRAFIAERYKNLKTNSFYANYNDRTSQTSSVADHSRDKTHACYVRSYQGIC